MPTYVVLYRWTDQGIKNVKETVDRAEQLIQAQQQAGLKVHGFWWTQGTYDLVAVGEWPDEDTAMAWLLRTGMTGNVRSETLRAFGADDMRRILAKIG
jgi:uncharacterized protein with GYD domain